MRYLRAKRKQAVISVITVISIIGVAAGVMALVIGIAINNGFRSTLQRSLLGATAHVMMLEKEPSQGHRELARAGPAVAEDSARGQRVAGAVRKGGAVPGRWAGKSTGAELKGVPLDTPPDMLRHLKQGSFDELKNTSGLAGHHPGRAPGAENRHAAAQRGQRDQPARPI